MTLVWQGLDDLLTRAGSAAEWSDVLEREVKQKDAFRVQTPPTTLNPDSLPKINSKRTRFKTLTPNLRNS
eukprot:5371496-Amphidinium_carterae.1